MIERQRVKDFIRSFDRDRGSDALKTIEEEALRDHVPIIRKDTQELLRILLKMKRPERILEVGKDLESKGIIENAYYFDIAMRFEEKYSFLKPGTYEVSSAMKPSEILDVIAHVDGES